ncbi:MAG: DUF366 family protein [Candidatus Margulisiibacteriota bacterium]
MKTKFVSKKIDYDGSQLRSHFAHNELGVTGDSIVSFVGAAAVKEHMVDMEDKRNKEFIYSDKMLHFIIEHFDRDLEKAVLRKRLFLTLVMDEINKKAGRQKLFRSGNGLYDGKKKLTVAVATTSPVSTLIHVGLNITEKGAPIKVACLEEYGIQPKRFATDLMQRYHDEIGSLSISIKKVKGVS